MTFETADRHRQSALKLPKSQSTRCASGDLVGDRRPLGEVNSDWAQLRAPTPQNRAPSGPHVEALAPEREDQHGEHDNEARRDEPRRSILRRRPFAFVGALILLFVALPAGYLYWDYASHFESTGDAFIAARQFPIAPKAPGYLTAVPARRNRPFLTGRGIPRIEEPHVPNALAPAKCQL